MELIFWIAVAIVVLVLASKVLVAALGSWNEATARQIEAATEFANSEPLNPPTTNTGHPLYLAAIQPSLIPGEEVEAIFDCSRPHWREHNLKSGISYLNLLAVTSKRIIHYKLGDVESIPYKVINVVKLGAAFPERDGRHEYVWRTLDVDTESDTYDFHLYQQDGKRAHDLILSHLL